MTAKAIENLKNDFPTVYAWIKKLDEGGCLIPLSAHKKPVIKFSGNDPLPKLPDSCERYGIELKRAGLVLLDLDRNHADGQDGVAQWSRLRKERQERDGGSYWQTTPSGGYHKLSLAPRGRSVKSRSDLAKIGFGGIDLKGAGEDGTRLAFVVGPGSAVYRKKDGEITDELAYYLPKADVVPADDFPIWFLDEIAKRDEAHRAEARDASLATYALTASDGSLSPYKQKILDATAEQMRSSAKGSIDSDLNTHIFGLGRKGIPWADVEAAIMPAAMAAGATEAHTREPKWAKVWEQGNRNYNPSEDKDFAVNPPEKEAVVVANVAKAGTKKKESEKAEASKLDTDAETRKRELRVYYSDAEIGKRFLDLMPHIRYIPFYKQWMIYDEQTGIWVKSNDVDLRGEIQAYMAKCFSEVESSGTFSERVAAESLLRLSTAKRVVEWLQSETRTLPSVFDLQKDLIVVANGVVSLRTSELLPFSPNYLFTRRIAHDYIPDAKNEWTDLALGCLNEDALGQFKVLAGQALTGHQPSRSTIHFLYGGGSNGKSTILDLLAETAGDYGGMPKKEVLLKGSGNQFSSISFKGIRQAVIEELPDERFLDGGVVRDLAGTKRMRGEHKGKDSEEFEVNATIFISFNNRPQVSETAHGVWRRLKLFTFPFTYHETEKNIKTAKDRLQHPMLKDLHEKSEDAVVAFLAWRIEGAREWYENGCRDAEDAPSVAADSLQWRLGNDQLAAWFNEHMKADPKGFVLVDDLLDDFNRWRNSRKTDWGKANFVDKLINHSLFDENGLEYCQAKRHSNLVQSLWERDNSPEWEQPRVAKTQATFIKGVRFASELDSVVIPDTAEGADYDYDYEYDDDDTESIF